jgi:hypothetical protein
VAPDTVPAPSVAIVTRPMATASRPAAAPSADPRSARTLRHVCEGGLVAVGVALLLRVVYAPSHINYDARYALLWARDAARGLTPDYKADFAPTPHPLETAVSVLSLPFGDAADRVMAWLILLCFGVLVWLTFRLGAELFSGWVGLVAALVVLTRPALERDALLGYQDTAFAALIVAAVLLEAQRRRRGAPVLVLLAVAGLMRPEAWVLGGLYVLWLWAGLSPRGRAGCCALAAAAPVLWALSDWAVTGDPLHSLHGTADLAAAVDRRRRPGQAPYWTAQYYGYVLREPVLVGIAIGLFFAWRQRLRGALLPLVVVAAMTLVFMAGSLFGLPLIGRYVRTPSVLLTLFYGLAVCGFLLLPAGRARTRWLIVGALTAALSLAWLPWHVRMLDDLHGRLARDGRMYADLRAAAEAPAVRAAVAGCGGRISAADHRPIPHLRWWLDLPPGAVGTPEGGASPLARVLLLPRDNARMRRFYGPEFPALAAPDGWSAVYRNGSWRVVAAPGC